MPWPAYFWPGLPQLARDGNWTALAFAVVSAVMLNAVIVGTWFWTDIYSSAVRIILWIFLGVVWGAGVAYWAWSDRRRAAASGKTDGKTFEEALEDYLKGNWFEAERKLNHLLRRVDHDLEARLLMATLLRHTKRFDEATRQLNVLVRLDGAHRWAPEIHREGELLMEARKNNISSDDSEHESKGDN
jgi:uncharacterized protein HemY